MLYSDYSKATKEPLAITALENLDMNEIFEKKQSINFLRFFFLAHPITSMNYSRILKHCSYKSHINCESSKKKPFLLKF